MKIIRVLSAADPVRFLILMLMAAIFMLAGCARPPKLPLAPVSSDEFPQFDDDLAFDQLEEAIRQSLVYFGRIPADREFTFAEERFTAAHLILSLERFLEFIKQNPSSQQIHKFIKFNYLVYRAAGRENSKVLFTGYYEPLINGSLVQTEIYQHPIYGRPDDLLVADLSLFSPDLKGKKIVGRVDGRRFVPYYERKEIALQNALDGKAEILAFVNDPVDVFFLHIQGSGRILLANGENICVHYHSKNGRPYRSIGQVLIDQEKITREEMSMQAIRRYLKNHPEEIDAVLNHNPSYVFFSIEPDGPLGAINVPLTPGRSIATDSRIFPRGALVFIKAQKPVVNEKGEILQWIDCSRFVLNQDTGGAIKGPGRADMFWGNGPYAEIAAGHMKHEGDMFFLVLKH